jgi:hypothetical protein
MCNAHYFAAERNSRKNQWLGIPVTALTALVATSIFGTLSQKETILWLSILTGGFSVAAVILSSLQTFLRYSEIAQEHRSAAVAYESMRRNFDLFLLKYRSSDNREAALADLQKLSGNLDSISEKAPTVSDAVYDAANKITPLR